MIGILSAFGAAFSWTYACFIWRSQTLKYRSIDINLIKNIIAFLVFIPAFINLNSANELKNIFTLLFSGIIGIGLGDTFYLKSLQIIGTRKTLSIETLSPLMAALSGEIFINENLTSKSWIGIIIVSISLFIILKKGTEFKKENSAFSRKNNFKIYIFPFLSVLCAVVGGLFSRIVFLKSNLSPLLTTEIRLLGAIIFLFTLKGFKINFFLNNLEKSQKKRFLFSIFLGTNIGILLQQIVFKNLPLGLGWALLSTSPVISLFFTKNEERQITKETIFFTCFLFLGLTLIIF
ncbi:DMT family transporter [uncultured Prochlorococcus sp.]|uniref:DMT family transporter n=1 Tax=uncultured Prochlorococcus sp. TaxID=159733 RepID=UPI0025841496|nr:DMT family transporter [uncultured Prochlorococcus sp.]